MLPGGPDADIVQAGVQLMNFRSSWLTVHNVLEYYFWFRSRLHRPCPPALHPARREHRLHPHVDPACRGGLGPDCLAEDCEIGVRLSALGARTAVFYEPELVTREECPPTLRAFIRQRTRWNQGYLQTLCRGYWRRLPLRQRALGAYILASPYCHGARLADDPGRDRDRGGREGAVSRSRSCRSCRCCPCFDARGGGCRAGGVLPDCTGSGARRCATTGAWCFGLLLYQAVLALAAARAVVREARGARGWEKTAHLGLHLGGPGQA